jgi:hypothetical protein
MMLQHLFPCVQLLLFHVVTYACQCFTMFLANVTDVEFQCCKHVMLSVVSRGEGGGP